MSRLTQIFEWDLETLIWINQGWSNSFFDLIFPVLRNKYFWVWLYLIILYIAIKKDKRFWILLILAGTTVFLCDGISAGLIKPYVGRIRPCNDPSVVDQIRLLVPCGSGYSFISAHASNHFGLAMIFSGYLSQWYRPRNLYLIFLPWAAFISIAQVYVGVHYPLDVFFGALLGISIGSILIKAYIGAVKLKTQD